MCAYTDRRKNHFDYDGKFSDKINGTTENYPLNNDRMTIEQLVDYVQMDLTISDLLPRVLPDLEILRIIKETALDWFYKTHQHASMKSYYRLKREFINCEEYTMMGFITMPEEVENIVRVSEINDPSLFRIGIQSPNLSINFGVTNQPYLTSFVTNVGELAVYRQILSSFSDEVNKLARNYTKFSYDPISKRFNILDEIRTDYMLDVYVRIPQEEVFNHYLFKNYVVALSRIRLGDALERLTFNLPGAFQYNAAATKESGNALLEKTLEDVKNQSPNSSFFIMRR